MSAVPMEKPALAPTAARLGTRVSRVDGPVKVQGQARYAAEHPVPDMLFAVAVSGAIAKGRIARIDDAAARALPGVVDVLTHANRPKMRSWSVFHKDMIAPGGKPFKPLLDDQIHYSGQPVAVVVAETFEAARAGAALVEVEYNEEPHDSGLLSHLARRREPSHMKYGFVPPPKPRGDADKAFADAPVKIDAEFHSGPEHHNPMEMHASTVHYGVDGSLTIYDKTQGSQNCRWYVSHVFGLPKDKVTVLNPFVGGAFGSGLRPQYQLTLSVMAALHLKRSVRLVLTRQQMFTFGHRPETWQRVQLAADSDGGLQAVIHQAVGATSRLEDYTEVVVNWAGQLYRCPNVRLKYDVVELDQASPMDMRAPGAAHGLHALEIAMDELAHALQMDPLALRLRNYAHRDDSKDLPFSSKELYACFDQGAERFGWSARPLAPRSRREGRELVGWGMATGIWDAQQMFARVRMVMDAQGRVVASSAASDIGTGTYTVMALIAADALGLPLERVTFELGDSRMPVAPVQGASAHVATVGSAVAGASEKLARELLDIARKMEGTPFARVRRKQIMFEQGCLCLCSDPSQRISFEALLARAGKQTLEVSYMLLPNMLKQRKYTRATHSAVFCEVRVDEELGTVRVTRVVSAIAAGQILSAKTAESQIIGGVTWGISQALHEETQLDTRYGRFMNHSLAEYHVPVNAD
ncbi:MAG: xanthine dehydrogenase family protein molybdopterin-binding subunit, partial [Comamonas sp.]